MKILLTTCLALLLLSLSMTAQSVGAQNGMDQKSKEAIQAVIEAQRVAWNNGDIEGYMNGYEKSETTVFVSGGKVTHGWQTVFEHYKKSYDTREKMGELTFSDLEFTSLGKDHVSVVGRWALKRSNDAPHGLFTLIFKKTKPGWRIIHDHTS